MDAVGGGEGDVAELGPERYAVYRALLADASVAVVLPITWSDIGDPRRREGVLKLLRPGVEAKLAEELDVLAAVAQFLDERRASYDLPGFEYRDTFDTVRELLAHEVRL